LRDGPASLTLGFASLIDLSYCQQHAHAVHELVLHPSGRGRTRLADGTCFEFVPGDAVLYGPQQRHDQQLDVPGEDLCLQFTLPRPVPELDRALFLPQACSAVADSELRRLSQRVGDGPIARQTQNHRLSAVLLQILERVAPSEPTAVAGHALRARQLIAERYQDPGRVADIARELGIGEDHLRHLFTDTFGQSPVQWLTEVRLARAKELLANTPLGLAEIARQVGWATERHLCTVFRRAVGTSPAAWRRQRR
jgi:AraC-like DNA-binding protein